MKCSQILKLLLASVAKLSSVAKFSDALGLIEEFSDIANVTKYQKILWFIIFIGRHK